MPTNLESYSEQPSEDEASKGKKSPAGDSAESAEWREHEHVSAQVQLEAEKLVALVGTPELAKQAIKVVEERQRNLSTAGCDPKDSLKKSQQVFASQVQTIQDALTAFETSLATPVISGELTDWTTNALRDCEKVKVMLLGDVKKAHQEVYSRILRENADLTSQVEKLREADLQISGSDCDEVLASLTQLLRWARVARQDEAKLTEMLAQVTKRAMDFVIAARGQETAIAAWLSEAFNRDLGSGD